MLGFGFWIIAQPVLPAESLEVLWETWRLESLQLVYNISKDELLRFPLFDEPDVDRILRERKGPPFRSWRDFFVRTGIDPNLRPFLESWLDLRPRGKAEAWVEGRSDRVLSVGNRITWRSSRLWFEGRYAPQNPSIRLIFGTPWVSVGTFRPVGGWGGPFAPSLWSSLTLQDRDVVGTRVDSVLRLWIHTPVYGIRIHGIYPEKVVGVESKYFSLWIDPNWATWIGIRGMAWGLERAPDSVFPWSITWKHRGTILRWAWRWAPQTNAMEGRWRIRVQNMTLRFRYITYGKASGSLRAWLSGRGGRDAHWWIGWWEKGGWVGIRQGPWRWRWGMSTGRHRVEVGFWDERWGVRIGAAEEGQTLRILERSWPVNGGYGIFSWHHSWKPLQLRLQLVISHAESLQGGGAFRLIWREWVP